MTAYLFFSVLVITFGSHFQFGYAIGSINAPAIVSASEACSSLMPFALAHQEHDQRQPPLDVWQLPDWRDDGYRLGKRRLHFPVRCFDWRSDGYVNGIWFWLPTDVLLAGYLADRFGRRLTLHVNNFLAILAAAAMTSADFLGYHGFYPLFHFGRLLIGLNSGWNLTYFCILQLPCFRHRLLHRAALRH